MECFQVNLLLSKILSCFYYICSKIVSTKQESYFLGEFFFLSKKACWVITSEDHTMWKLWCLIVQKNWSTMAASGNSAVYKYFNLIWCWKRKKWCEESTRDALNAQINSVYRFQPMTALKGDQSVMHFCKRTQREIPAAFHHVSSNLHWGINWACAKEKPKTENDISTKCVLCSLR